jgi:hypothetical protein
MVSLTQFNWPLDQRWNKLAARPGANQQQRRLTSIPKGVHPVSEPLQGAPNSPTQQVGVGDGSVDSAAAGASTCWSTVGVPARAAAIPARPRPRMAVILWSSMFTASC